MIPPWLRPFQGKRKADLTRRKRCQREGKNTDIPEKPQEVTIKGCGGRTVSQHVFEWKNQNRQTFGVSLTVAQDDNVL